jgi:hypothetical protein
MQHSLKAKIEQHAVAQLQLHGLTEFKYLILSQLNTSSFTYNNASIWNQMQVKGG